MEKTIVVLENDEDILDITRLILVEDGYQVIGYANVSSHEELMQGNPELILLDLWLDKMNGSKICKGIKSDPLTRHIPVVLLSAVSNIQAVAMACEADFYIQKPFDLDNFQKVIRQIIDKS